MRRRPALRFVLLVVGGILLSQLFPSHPAVALLILASTAGAMFLLRFIQPAGVWFLASCHVSVAVLGYAIAVTQEASMKAGRVFSAYGTVQIQGSGIVEEPPIRQGNAVRMVLTIDSLSPGEAASVQGKTFLVALPKSESDDLPTLEVGQRVRIEGLIDDFPRPRNPGEFDYGRFLSLNEIDGVVRASGLAVLDSVPRDFNLRRWFAALRAKFGAVLEAHHGREQAGFLRGVVFGDRRDLPLELKQSFIDTGTIHILAVSGSNVAVIALILYLTFGLLRFPRTSTILLTMSGLWFYMMLTGASSSIIRATIMGCVILGGKLTERRTDIYNSICVAGCVVLLWNPLQLFDVGFQLSFAAVLSIVYFYPKLTELLRSIPAELEEIRALNAVWQVFAVSFAAQLGTLPFTAYYFERFSIISVAANLVVVPIVGLNLMIGCLTLASAYVSQTIASVYAAVNEVLTNILIGSVRIAARVPHAYVETGGFSLGDAFVYYFCIFGLFNLRNSFVVKMTFISVLCILTIGIYQDVLEESRGMLRVTMLDVGQGDCHVIRFPNGKTMLIDAGPSGPAFDAGSRIIGPFLRRQGYSRIDAVLVTHPHSDHSGGVLALLKTFPIGVFFEAEREPPSQSHEKIHHALQKAGVERKIVEAGAEISLDPSVRLYVLHPLWSSDSSEQTNNRSLVLRLVFGVTSAVFAGDAEEEAERLVGRRFGRFLDSELLKTGHHGSATSTTEEFLDGITPNFAIISVGRRNKFGHPSATVMNALERRGIEALRTDDEGAIIFESDGRRWSRIQWRTRNP